MGRNGEKSVIMWISRQGDKKNYGSKTRKIHRSQEREPVQRGEPVNSFMLSLRNQQTPDGMVTGVLA